MTNSKPPEEGMIYTLSDYQIGGLFAYYKYVNFPPPHNITIEHIGLIEGGDLIIEFKRFGEMRVEKIPRHPQNNEP